MRGIYQIRNQLDGKRYIGKSSNVGHRLSVHRCDLKQPVRRKDTNRYLHAAVQKYGIQNFNFESIEVLDGCTDGELSDRELFWMDHFNTCDRNFGYNLRRDSSTLTTVHPETRRLHAINSIGKGNSNYGNKWDEYMKWDVGDKVRRAHADGRYDAAWREKQRVAQLARVAGWTDADRAEHARAAARIQPAPRLAAHRRRRSPRR